MNLSYRLNQLVWGSLDWLFPPQCGGCKRVGYRWCPDCQEQVLKVPEPVCDVCGTPQTLPGLCPDCRTTPPPYNMLRSWSVFEGPVRQALHSLKYRRNLPLGEVLARQLAEYVRALGWSVDMVVPIPLGSKRLKERGYNQAGLVAMPLASIHRWRFIPRALIRIRDTRTQVGLSIAERKENVRGAFSAREELVRGKSILLMDDVATTGATLAAGATALMEAGAKNVFGLTLARAGAHHGLTFV